MSETGFAGWLADHHVYESPAERISRMAWQAEQRADRQAKQDEAERAAALEDQREQRMFRFAQLGVQPGAAFDAALRSMDEDSEYEDCRARMEKIEKRRESRRSAQLEQARMTAAVAQRANSDPLEAASRRAAEALKVHNDDVLRRARAQYREGTRRAPAPASVRAARPFGNSGGRAYDDAQREGRARLENREITRVCAPGDDGVLRNYGPVSYR